MVPVIAVRFNGVWIFSSLKRRHSELWFYCTCKRVACWVRLNMCLVEFLVWETPFFTLSQTVVNVALKSILKPVVTRDNQMIIAGLGKWWPLWETIYTWTPYVIHEDIPNSMVRHTTPSVPSSHGYVYMIWILVIMGTQIHKISRKKKEKNLRCGFVTYDDILLYKSKEDIM